MIYKLGDICDIFDGPHATPAETSSGPIFLGIKNISEQCELDFTDVKHLSESDYVIWTKRVIPQEDDIVFSYEATLNRYALIPSGFYGCLGRRLAIARVKDKSIVNPHYLYHYFCSPKWKAFILANKVIGSTVLRVSVEEFPEYEVDLPDIAIQNSVAKLLDGITEKRDNNNALCSNLEAMAKLIYDYWFVQFDFPDEHGKPYKSSGGKMVWNDELKREIPAGWEVKPLGMICHCLLGGTPSREKAEYWNGNINWINSGAVNEFRISVPSETITEAGLANTSTYLMPRNTTVLAITGATLGQVSILNIDSCANQSVIGVLENKRVPTEYIYPSVVSSMKLLMRNQTGGAQQHINKDDVQSMNLLIPSEHVMDEYMANVKYMYDEIMEKCAENQQLASLRDFLLPMLMNGQVKVG